MIDVVASFYKNRGLTARVVVVRKPEWSILLARMPDASKPRNCLTVPVGILHSLVRSPGTITELEKRRRAAEFLNHDFGHQRHRINGSIGLLSWTMIAVFIASLCRALGGPVAEPAVEYRDMGNAEDFNTKQNVYFDVNTNFAGTGWPSYWNMAWKGTGGALYENDEHFWWWRWHRAG